MLNLEQIALLEEQAAEDASQVYNDSDNPDSLSPSTFDGDGEAFHCGWVDLYRHHISSDDMDQSKEIYLNRFWDRVQFLQYIKR